MEYRDWIWLMVVAFTVVLSVINSRAAYFNGVVDGAGYVLERNCPGYRRAGEYLRKYMGHRWPWLTQGGRVAVLMKPEIRKTFPLEDDDTTPSV